MDEYKRLRIDVDARLLAKPVTGVERYAYEVLSRLVVGTVKEILSLRRTQSSRTDSPQQPDSPA